MSTIIKFIGGALIFSLSSLSSAAVIESQRADFETKLGTAITDDYASLGYQNGDSLDTPHTDIHTNAHVSSIFGETTYQATGFENNNIISGTNLGNPRYCAGCNGSFKLSFRTTSIGTSNGVFGVGLNILLGTDYFAYVTFGDGSSDNFALPNATSFWGLTSNQLISSIHFGLINGVATQSGALAIDNLTIGTAAKISEPSTLALFCLGILGLVSYRRKI